jgi:hypothetical protein
MNSTWINLLLELALFIILGILYYFYQKKKILADQKNLSRSFLEMTLQACLREKNHYSNEKLDQLIICIDDYLNDLHHPTPYQEMKLYLHHPDCSEELKVIMRETLQEVGHGAE